jgi:hypothetical protein
MCIKVITYALVDGARAHIAHEIWVNRYRRV